MTDREVNLSDVLRQAWTLDDANDTNVATPNKNNSSPKPNSQIKRQTKENASVLITPEYTPPASNVSELQPPKLFTPVVQHHFPQPHGFRMQNLPTYRNMSFFYGKLQPAPPATVVTPTFINGFARAAPTTNCPEKGLAFNRTPTTASATIGGGHDNDAFPENFLEEHDFDERPKMAPAAADPNASSSATTKSRGVGIGEVLDEFFVRRRRRNGDENASAAKNDDSDDGCGSDGDGIEKHATEASGDGDETQTLGSGAQKSTSSMFYQPQPQQAAAHHARNTPPPGYPQVVVVGFMRPHEEETRQIMNLDNQQAHNSSPTSSWNSHPQQYAQMSPMNAYPPRGPPMYAPPPPPQMHHHHQGGAPQPPPTSNPYYQPHMPQAPMMPPGMHGQPQQQQPYYSTQSPLTGTPPTMNYGNTPMPIPTTNGNGPVFSFTKPRASESNATNRRKKNHNNNEMCNFAIFKGNSRLEDGDAAVFPDMNDFPLLDAIQSKAKKEAGRKPCRPHLCEQSRMLISRVAHFNREFVKRLPSRHPLANSPMSRPDQWTSAIMGISLATVRKCLDMATEEEVFTRCTDKNLVNLTPAERVERDELLAKLSTVFEDEKALGAGTANLTIAEYSPRRSYSNSHVSRQPVEDKTNTMIYMPNGDNSNETTLLNLDEHSNSSKGIATPTPNAESAPEIETEPIIIEQAKVEELKQPSPKIGADTPRVRGRPKKVMEMKKKRASVEASETLEDKDEHEKKTEDENETTDESEKNKPAIEEQEEREDDAASSEGTNRSETATPEPNSVASSNAAVAAATTTANAVTASGRPRRGKKRTIENEENVGSGRKKRAVNNNAKNAMEDDENEHKMVTR
ncbi:unnamed protein product [Caenorhabditis bovis]|uniref:Uncharacterized protein n=1 Tax=Caenorhabditis bovis TaxID=2654633 RepID=A0A8S1FDM7_9PELO|nr:unnamed protein product [Caenorhabditis bovis]